MARRDPRNLSAFWTLPTLPGVEFLHARYATLTFAPHVHEELVIGMTEGGAGYFTTNGREHIATGDTLILFNPDEPHHGGVAEGGQWQYRALYLKPEALERLRLQITESNRPAYFSASNVADAALVGRALDFHRAAQPGAAALALETGLLDLMASAILRHGDLKARLPRCGRAEPVIGKIKDYIHAHYAADVQLGDLASLAGMSAFQVLRAFRKQTGLTPHAYLNQVRLAKSKALISSGCPLTDVAITVGFFDQSHLVRHFKRSFGITPGQFVCEPRQAAAAPAF
jgi:AraC-like DNA-binding protein